MPRSPGDPHMKFIYALAELIQKNYPKLACCPGPIGELVIQSPNNQIVIGDINDEWGLDINDQHGSYLHSKDSIPEDADWETFKTWALTNITNIFPDETKGQ